MADQGRWFKLWVEALTDPDTSNLSIADFGRWAKFGSYLKAHGTDGSIHVMPPARSLLLMLELDTFEALMTCVMSFPNCQIWRDDPSSERRDAGAIITWRNWRKYQIDSSAERQRRYRHRQAFGVTTKKRREEKRREEKKLPPSSPPAQGSLLSGNGHESGSEFDRFWQIYPRKVGKGAARQAWAKRHPPITDVLTALARQSGSEQWQRDDGQFIPHPATWLNQDRWQDEPETPPTPDPYAKFPRVR